MQGINIFDLETTGLQRNTARIIEYGGFLNGVETSALIDCGEPIPDIITKITGITQAHINKNGIPWEDFANETLMPVLEASEYYGGHNVLGFDIPILRNNLKRIGLKMPERPFVDTLLIAKRYLKDLKNNKLGTVCSHYDIYIENAHRAVDDSKANAEMLQKLIDDIFDGNIEEALSHEPTRLGPHAIGLDPMLAMIL